ncbi:hypothetical protein RD792_007924 [Penstemon davidsonii]|uniref:Uncharacterized protein n=1 Tax=Penstemon davidsonii TaxID=160366 RepID=A0ABR0D8H7_9LAMI|nr:hypothetical protein RD792_007924 [Penstemon davidsonii]
MSSRGLLLFNFVTVITVIVTVSESRELIRPFNNTISAVYVFGDSTVDSGNNNYINTVFKANFPPYGTNFANHTPTGRFCDGRLVMDFMTSYVGVKENVPPYLDPTLSLDELMTGVCFASSGTGLDPLTAQLFDGVITVPKQLENFKEYKTNLEASIGKNRTKTLIKKAAFLISIGTNDIAVNYMSTPLRRLTYNITVYLQVLLQQLKQLIEGLREEGAQIIGLVGLPPIGCVPAVITLYSGQPIFGRPCVDTFSNIALDYNNKLQDMLKTMQKPNSILVYADIYQPLNDIVHNPSKYGFEKTNVGCCGTGLIEATFLCNSGSVLCSDPSKYVFFDAIHPTETTYRYLFESIRPTMDRFLKKLSQLM